MGDYLVLEPVGGGGKPAIVFWDLAEAKLDVFTGVLQEFLRQHRPVSLMISGPMEHTWPGIELLGAELLRHTLLPSHTSRNSNSAATYRAEHDACPVCDGTGMLVRDSCPLCQ